MLINNLINSLKLTSRRKRIKTPFYFNLFFHNFESETNFQKKKD